MACYNLQDLEARVGYKKESYKQDAGQNYEWVWGKTKRDVITKEQLGVASLQHKMPKNVELCFGDQQIKHALY